MRSKSFKRRLFVSAFTVFIITCISTVSFAATYYISPLGNDLSGNGSTTSPWKSLSYACSKVTTAGNTIYINSGSYTDNNRCNLAVGVNIQGAGKSSVTITSAFNGAYIYRDTPSANPVPHGNNDIGGFTLDGSNKTLKAGIWIKGTDYITIHDIKFRHIKTSAIRLVGWDNWPDYATATVTPPPAYGYNNVIRDVEIDDCTSQTTESSDDRLGAIDLLALANCQVYNVTINENYPNHGTGIKNALGWLKGFKLYNSTITTDHGNPDSFVIETYNFLGDAEIYNCNFNHFISLNGGVKTLVSGSSWNLKIHDNTFNMTGLGGSGHEFSHNWLNVYNNYFYGASGPAVGLWTTNYLTSTGVTHWRFNNNVIYNCADGIFIPRGANSYVEIYNNVFDTMTARPWGGSGIDTAGFTGTLSGAKIQNNLIMNAAAAPITIGSNLSNTLVDHNWFYNNGNSNNVSNSSSSTTQTNNVKGVKPDISYSGNRPDPYYRPSSSTSNLENAGVSVGLPYSGVAPQIGAYQYSKTVVSLIAPSNLRIIN